MSSIENVGVTPRDVLAAVTNLESWRNYPEARADFVTFVVGQQSTEAMIRLQWTAYVFGWISHKAYVGERQILETRKANRAEVEKLG